MARDHGLVFAELVDALEDFVSALEEEIEIIQATAAVLRDQIEIIRSNGAPDASRMVNRSRDHSLNQLRQRELRLKVSRLIAEHLLSKNSE